MATGPGREMSLPGTTLVMPEDDQVNGVMQGTTIFVMSGQEANSALSGVALSGMDSAMGSVYKSSP